MKLYLVFLLFGLAFAQEGEVEGGAEEVAAAVEEEELGDGFVFDLDWPQNSERLAGAVGRAAISSIDSDQVCTIILPTNVALFHIYDAFFVPGSNAATEYLFMVPPYANDTKQFGFVLNFERDVNGDANTFNASDVELSCGAGDTNYGVSSFPADMDQDYNNMILMKRDGYHTGDFVIVRFPVGVANVSVNTRRNETVATTEDVDGNVVSITITDFVQAEATGPYSTDANKQIHIGFFFVDGNRFQSSQVTYEVFGQTDAE